VKKKDDRSDGSFEGPILETAVTEILRAGEHLQACFSEALKPFGVSFTQYSALRILNNHGQALSCSELGSRMVTRDSDITRLVERLVARGWAVRQRDERDRRVVKITLTPEGRTLFDQLAGRVELLVHKPFENLKPKRVRRLVETLQKVQVTDFLS
jgi:DNA-binding MarR family transcriptional regulator